MQKHVRVVAIAAVSFGLLGCSISRSRDGEYTTNWRIWETIFKSKDRSESQDSVSGLWREGYGFNNPNNERRRQDLPPLNFDGSVYQDE